MVRLLFSMDRTKQAINKILRESPYYKVGQSFRVPMRRACPKCGALQEPSVIVNHETGEVTQRCKYKHCCVGCKIEFCFYCLNTGPQNAWLCGDPFSKGKCGAKAPPQVL